MVQLREVGRFPLKVPVIFVWRDHSGSHSGTGFTTDLSVHGLYVASTNRPPLRAIVRCEVFLPSLDVRASNCPLHGTAIGRVIRLDYDCGFAVQSRTFSLRDKA